MTVVIKLDAGAVASLFATPEARLELQQAVIAEVVRRMFDKYAPSEVRQMIDGEFSKQKGALVESLCEEALFAARLEPMFEKAIADVRKEWSGASVKIRPEVKAKLDAAVEEKINTLLPQYGLQGEQLVKAAVEAAFTRVSERALANIDAQIERKIKTITGAEIDRRVQDRLTAAMKVVP